MIAPSKDAITFALERLDDAAAVELRNQKGKILACGDVISHSFSNGNLHLRFDGQSLHLPDCPKAGTLQTVDLCLDEIALLEIVMPYDEFYLYSEKNWLHAHWTRPVKNGSAPFKELPAQPAAWRRYARPPKAIPGAFWPELRLASGVYGMTRTQDMGIPVALALEFRVHPALYRMGIFLELGHYSRLHNAYPEAISGHRLIAANLGVQYAFWQREYFSIAATLSGGLIHYFYAAGDENGSGIRPTFGMGVIAFWHLLHNNRDRHKISLFCQPLLTIIFNRDNHEWLHYPLLGELRAGVQYAY